MEKRYQVFVSSTYEDLHEERQEVMQGLLQLDFIPSGMELFPAASEDQWTLIKKVIDDCDYYVAIIGGRYGSTGRDGKSYTQMEYEYAVEKQKPVIAFLHANPGQIPASKTEATDEGKRRLEQFRQLCQTKMVKFWSSPKDLGAKVSVSIVKLKEAHPGIGWVRADKLPRVPNAAMLSKMRERLLSRTAAQSRRPYSRTQWGKSQRRRFTSTESERRGEFQPQKELTEKLAEELDDNLSSTALPVSPVPSAEDLPPPPTVEEVRQQNEAYEASGKKIDAMISASGTTSGGSLEMTFERVIESFYMSALIQMGAIRQEGEQAKVDIIGARQTIDSLNILQEKTDKSMTKKERVLMQNVLFELRMAWIEITNAVGAATTGPSELKKRK